MAETDPRDPMVRAIEAIAARMTADMADHPVARQMQAEVNAMRLKAQALDSVNRSRSPLDTPAAHVLKVAKMARVFDKDVTALLNRAGDLYRQGIADVQRRIDEKVNLKPDAFAQEIRTAVREMKSAQKMDLVKRLVDENRGPELAAIVKAPSTLTGITDQERATFEQMIYGKHAGAEMGEIAGINELLETVAVAARAAGTMVKGLTDPGQLAAIESRAAEAAQAADAFNQTMQ